MSGLQLRHFERAIVDIYLHGDNDTLPFDVDNRFIAECREKLAKTAFNFSQELVNNSKQGARNSIDELQVFSERLLVPAGPSGFRITTKIHPFWNLYFNALGIAIAEVLEPTRSDRVHSYRFIPDGDRLFDRNSSWRQFREASLQDCENISSGVVVQTDISSFYEHISHHRIENRVDDLFGVGSSISDQVDRFLSKFAAGRSFGLPVGGQCARILAELLLSSIDRQLSDSKIVWRRFVDDFVLVTQSQTEAYGALSVLSHALADYGLTLNRTKTILLSTKHYIDYTKTQLGSSGDEATKLSEIDLHFDPYSDTPETDYDDLRVIVESLDVRALLDGELRKSQPDTFLVTQIGRTLKLHSAEEALKLCSTLLAPANLHAFRASWSTIMRGIASVCGDGRFSSIADALDKLLDTIPSHSPHLLMAEASCLHYLRTLRFRRTELRAQYVLRVYTNTSSVTVRRACLDCWRLWKDRPSFTRERNRWNSLSAEEQRMLWYSAGEFGDEGEKFRDQVRRSLTKAWGLGIERSQGSTFASEFSAWAAK
jgi:Reverse transcriptase (RNA-dependent DNA polymerase)